MLELSAFKNVYQCPSSFSCLRSQRETHILCKSFLSTFFPSFLLSFLLSYLLSFFSSFLLALLLLFSFFFLFLPQTHSALPAPGIEGALSHPVYLTPCLIQELPTPFTWNPVFIRILSLGVVLSSTHTVCFKSMSIFCPLHSIFDCITSSILIYLPNCTTITI